MTEYPPDGIPAVSLKKLGLQARELECPAGGQHHVPTQGVIACASVGGGLEPCLKCKETVVLDPIPNDTNGSTPH